MNEDNRTMQRQMTFDFEMLERKEENHVATATSLPPPTNDTAQSVSNVHLEEEILPTPLLPPPVQTSLNIADAGEPRQPESLCPSDLVHAQNDHEPPEKDLAAPQIKNLPKEIVAFLSQTPGREIGIGEIRHHFGFTNYDPAEPLRNPVHRALRELADARLVQMITPTWGEPRFSFLTPQKAPYTFDDFKAFHKEFFSGGITFEEYHLQFQRLLESRTAIETELKTRFKAPQMALLAARMGSWDAKRSTKDENAASIVRHMLSSFLLDGTVSYGMHERYEDAVVKKVSALTAGDYYHALEKKQEASMQRERALENPETLDDFHTFIREKGEHALTEPQLAVFDALQADITRAHRAKSTPTTVEQFQSEELAAIEFRIKDGFHDKRKCPLCIVQLTSRVDRDAFNELNRKAKMLGGWYSSFKKEDAGFQFLDKEKADRFTALLTSDVDRTDVLESRKDRKEQTAAERLHELAAEIFKRAEEVIEQSNDSLQNTVRRADIQAGVRGRAYSDQAMSRTLHSIAEALSRGDANYLDGIRHKTQIETLDAILHIAKWARVSAFKLQEGESTYQHGQRIGRIEEEPIGSITIRYALFPYPCVYKRHLADLVHHARNQGGLKQAASKMTKRLEREKDDYVTFKTTTDIELLGDFLDRAKAADIDTDRISSSLYHIKRLNRAGITNIHELRAALREYITHRAALRQDDPIQIAERELIGKDLPGFFPTPRPVIERMLELAAIQPQHTLLEPSCGKGDILDAIREQLPEIQLHAIEFNRSLAEVLTAKGHDVQFTDFLLHDGIYDRIVMNPPFEDAQEIDHVRHAYELLAPGGRLVSVMSEGPFFRQDNKALDFRQWLVDKRANTERLPDDAFQGREAFRQTGVRTRLVIINKEDS